MDLLRGFGILIAYFIACVSILVLLRHNVKIPQELFRKMLHTMLLFSLLIFIYGFNSWQASVVAALLFAVMLYPILALAERKITVYGELLTQRKPGELKRSLIVAFSMFGIIIALCWGLMGEKLLAVACVYAWGFGDAAAALVGKRFGKHFLEGKHIEGRKSMEGTLAMFVCSLFSVCTVLFIQGGLPWYAILITSSLTAAACAAVELYTKDGFDTITCPFAAAAIIIPGMLIWGGVAL